MTDPAASTDDLWTVQRILEWTTGFLKQKGVETPRLEAELLLAHARTCQRIHLYANFDEPLTDEERERMRGYVKRRAQREPLAYITGRREFYGRDFLVGPGVLVPRPETETLVDICLQQIPKDGAARICEVGFGSGCVAITLARQRRNVTVVATDISEVAAKYAAENVAAHEVDNRVKLLIGDGFESLKTSAEARFDGIVSNPPYIRKDELNGLAPEVAAHEPAEALVSGEDGLDLVRRLVADAPQFLKPGGWLALEIDPGQVVSVQSLMNDLGYAEIAITRDQFGNDRIISAIHAAK